MTLAEMQAELYRELRYTAAPPTATVTRLTAYLNLAHGAILTTPGLSRLRDDVVPIVANANKARTGLPPSVARIRALVNRTNNQRLQQVPLSDLRTGDPGQAFTGGFPILYSVVGNQAVQVQPAAATGLWVVSTVAGDTQNVFIETLRTGGYPSVGAAVAVTGVTRKALGALTDHIAVEKFYLSTAAVGAVSLYDAAVAGNELARIAIGQTSARYLAVEWSPIPTVDTTLYADITRTIQDLVNPTDEPLLPEDFHDLVVQGAKIMEYELIDDSRIARATKDYDDELADLRSWVLTDPDRVASLRPTVRGGWSQLGPSFPAGS